MLQSHLPIANLLLDLIHQVTTFQMSIAHGCRKSTLEVRIVQCHECFESLGSGFLCRISISQKCD